jgi:hypothetical protein
MHYPRRNKDKGPSGTGELLFVNEDDVLARQDVERFDCIVMDV